MKILYADESGNTGTDLDNLNQRIFVLGSFSVDHTKWHEINEYFSSKKVEIFDAFKDIEIHTNVIFSPPRKSIFHVKNWHDNLIILDKLIDLILELDIEFNFIAIDKNNFKLELQKKYGSLIKIDPYIYSFSILYNEYSKLLEKSNDKGIIFLDEILEIPKELNKIYPTLSKNNNVIIENALFLKSENTNFIQIADIFTFYICQYLNISKGYKKCSDFKKKHCIDNYNKLLSKTTHNILI